MKPSARMITLVLGLLVTAATARADGLSYLRISAYGDNIRAAVKTLDSLVFDGGVTWHGNSLRVVRGVLEDLRASEDAMTSRGTLVYLTVSGARDRLARSAQALDTLVYDQHIAFTTDAGKQAYRDALRQIRSALDLL